MTSEVSHFIARTGRVQSWVDNPESRLPVSCTVFVVDDSMEGPEGIEASWRFASYALRNGAGVSIHLSKLRPWGHENGKGLTASGPVSFAKIYSTLNEILRRGGTFKNGAITLHLDYDHPDAFEFITTDRRELPWCKRCLDVDETFLDYAPELIDPCLKAIASGDLWLNKIKYDEQGNRIYGNVCLEVYLPHRGTCLLQHVNLGQCSIGDLEAAFTEGMRSLVELHPLTGVGEAGVYRSPAEDKQVGLGILGLANFLAQEGVSYAELAQAFRARLSGTQVCTAAADTVVVALQDAIHAAASIACEAGMERAFAIAPTASCSYRSVDRNGFACTPELAPPIRRDVDRDSGTFGVQTYEYPPDVEIAAEVGWDDYKAVADGIVDLFEATGLFHGYSFNSWSDQVTYDRDFLLDWLYGPQTSLYYSLQVAPDTQDKDDALGILGDDASWFQFEALEDDEEVVAGFCSGADGGCSE
jgi:Ribonucleotide reductase, barrel domain